MVWVLKLFVTSTCKRQLSITFLGGLKPPNMIYLSDAKSSNRNRKWISKYLCFLLKNSRTHRTPEQGSPVELSAATAAKLLQSCPTLCNPIDGSPPGSPVPGIVQARTLEWVAISFCSAWKWKVKSESEVAQSCPTLRDPMDCSLLGSSDHGIFQARVLEWGAIAFSKIYTS